MPRRWSDHHPHCTLASVHVRTRSTRTYPRYEFIPGMILPCDTDLELMNLFFFDRRH